MYVYKRGAGPTKLISVTQCGVIFWGGAGKDTSLENAFKPSFCPGLEDSRIGTSGGSLSILQSACGETQSPWSRMEATSLPLLVLSPVC